MRQTLMVYITRGNLPGQLQTTTRLIDDAEPLRFRIHARDKLDSDSDIMLDQTRTIDNRRFMGGILTTLTESELIAVEESWKIVLGLGG